MSCYCNLLLIIYSNKYIISYGNSSIVYVVISYSISNMLLSCILVSNVVSYISYEHVFLEYVILLIWCLYPNVLVMLLDVLLIC